jgi:hypothetical protein
LEKLSKARPLGIGQVAVRDPGDLLGITRITSIRSEVGRETQDRAVDAQDLEEIFQ